MYCIKSTYLDITYIEGKNDKKQWFIITCVNDISNIVQN